MDIISLYFIVFGSLSIGAGLSTLIWWWFAKQNQDRNTERANNYDGFNPLWTWNKYKSSILFGLVIIFTILGSAMVMVGATL